MYEKVYLVKFATVTATDNAAWDPETDTYLTTEKGGSLIVKESDLFNLMRYNVREMVYVGKLYEKGDVEKDGQQNVQ